MPEGPDYYALSRYLSPVVGSYFHKVVLNGEEIQDELGVIHSVHSYGKSITIEGIKSTLTFTLGYVGKINYGRMGGQLNFVLHDNNRVALTGVKFNYGDSVNFSPPSEGLDVMHCANIKPYLDDIITAKKLDTGRRNIGAALLEQKCLLGVGNFIKCEALYKAKVHPNSKCYKLSHSRLRKVLIAVHSVAHACTEGTPVYSDNSYEPLIYGLADKVKTSDGRYSYIDSEVQVLYD